MAETNRAARLGSVRLPPPLPCPATPEGSSPTSASTATPWAWARRASAETRSTYRSKGAEASAGTTQVESALDGQGDPIVRGAFIEEEAASDRGRFGGRPAQGRVPAQPLAGQPIRSAQESAVEANDDGRVSLLGRVDHSLKRLDVSALEISHRVPTADGPLHQRADSTQEA